MTQAVNLDEETLRTSWTLVARIKNADDGDSWKRFYDFYSAVIRSMARKAGLGDDEAQDVLQETMASVAKNIGKFKPSPEHGSFRGWLLQMARWRIQDQFRKRLRFATVGDSASESSTTSLIERIPDPRELDFSALGEAEVQDRLKQDALKELQLQVKAEHFQIFHLLVVEQKSVSDVAKIVGRSAAQIYLIKHRLSKTLKDIVRRLDRKLG